MKDRICDNCKRSYDINRKHTTRCVYHDRYPEKTSCCDDWEERSDELISKDMALQAVADANTVFLAFAAVNHLPNIEKEV